MTEAIEVQGLDQFEAAVIPIMRPYKSAFRGTWFHEASSKPIKRDWLVDDLILARSFGIIYGPPGCIDGDAIVTVNRARNGRKMTLRDLVNRFNGNSDGRSGREWDQSIPTYIRCFWNGEFRLRRVLGAYPKGVKPVLKMELSDGKTLRLTPDHRVLTPQGWLRADQLAVGGMVVTNGTPAPTAPAPGVHRFIDQKGYAWISSGLKMHPFFKERPNSSYSYDMPEHRLAAEAGLNGMSLDAWLAVVRSGNFSPDHVFLTSDQEVHHKDEDTTNNLQSNLEILTKSEHAKRHKFHRHLPVFLPKRGEIVSIVPDGEIEVFDITVEEAENFVANGIVVHNCGKSFLLTDLMLSCAAVSAGVKEADGADVKSSWFEYDINRFGVVYIVAEGSDDFVIRLHAWRMEHGLAPDAMLPFIFLPTSIDLQSDNADTDTLKAEIQAIDFEMKARFGVGVGVTVIDTVSRALAGGNENDSSVMGSFVRNCESIQQDLGIAVIAVHHGGKAGGTGPRGHESLLGAADFVAEVLPKTEEKPYSSWVIRKFKAGQAGQEHRFKLVPRLVDESAEGKPITSCVVESEVEEKAASVDDGAYRASQPELDLIKVLVDEINATGTAPPTGEGRPRRMRIDVCLVVSRAAVGQAYKARFYSGDINKGEAGLKSLQDRWKRSYQSLIRANVIDADGDVMWMTGKRVKGSRIAGVLMAGGDPGEDSDPQAGIF